MSFPYTPLISNSLGELWDKIGWMTLASPQFIDRTGYFPHRNIETTFLELNESLNFLRKKLGEERYAAMIALSDRMRALFEADPEDKTGEAAQGQMLLQQMEELLRQARTRKKLARPGR